VNAAASCPNSSLASTLSAILDDEASPIATDDDRWTIYRGKTAALARLHAARRRTPRRISTR